MGEYAVDDDGKFFGANFKSLDGNTILYLYNFQYLRKSGEVGISDVAKEAERGYLKMKTSGDLLDYRSTITKFSNADAAVFTIRAEKFRMAHLIVKTGSGGFIQALVTAKDDAGLAKALGFLKKKLAPKSFQTVTGDKAGLIAVDNLYSSDQNFSHLRTVSGGSVGLTPFSDVDSKLKTVTYSANDIAGYTFDSYFQEQFSDWSDDSYFYEASIKKTDKGEPYGYFLTRNDTYKYSDDGDGEPSYMVHAFFFDAKQDGGTYYNDFRFTFSKPESKKAIDDFLKKVSTSSGKLPFASGSFIFGKNYVSSPEFDFTYPATPPKGTSSK